MESMLVEPEDDKQKIVWQLGCGVARQIRRVNSAPSRWSSDGTVTAVTVEGRSVATRSLHSGVGRNGQHP